MITVATVFYEGGLSVPAMSRCYTPAWVDKLYRGVARNYSKPFRFVCLTDDDYKFKEPIEQQPVVFMGWHTTCLQLHAINADRLLLMGLDTIITGNLDNILEYQGALAVPRDPYHPEWPCNGVVLCPTREDISRSHKDDMQALRDFSPEWLDDLFPGQILSYKVHVKDKGLKDARIVYFHGVPKPDTLEEDWIKENWK